MQTIHLVYNSDSTDMIDSEFSTGVSSTDTLFVTGVTVSVDPTSDVSSPKNEPITGASMAEPVDRTVENLQLPPI